MGWPRVDGSGHRALKRIAEAKHEMESDAKSFRLTSATATAASRGEEEERIARSTVSELRRSLFHHLNLLKSTMELHTCIIFWQNANSKKLRIVECVSDSDAIDRRMYSSREGVVGAVIQSCSPMMQKGLAPGHPSIVYYAEQMEVIDVDKDLPEKKAAAGGTETILLVEDEPTILRMTRLMLEKKGYTVLPAATPAEAVQEAKNHSGSIDLLMTDVVMPQMNGRDLARQIAELYPGIRFLFMSGYTANVIAHQGVLDDGVAFIQKPFSMADMTAKVREILDMAPDKVQ